jgi:hypothetical protein
MMRRTRMNCYGTSGISSDASKRPRSSAAKTGTRAFCVKTRPTPSAGVSVCVGVGCGRAPLRRVSGGGQN